MMTLSNCAGLDYHDDTGRMHLTTPQRKTLWNRVVQNARVGRFSRGLAAGRIDAATTASAGREKIGLVTAVTMRA